jgi:hypothetical protein
MATFSEQNVLDGMAHALMHEVKGAKKSARVTNGAKLASSAIHTLEGGGTMTATKIGDEWHMACDRCAATMVAWVDSKTGEWLWEKR